MPENKQYITHTQDHGTVMISEEVVAAIVIGAIKEVEGVEGIGGKLGFDLNSIKNWAKALNIVIGDNNSVRVECSIIVSYGQAVITVAEAAQNAIISAVESMTGVKPAAVNVNVSGIAHH